MTLSDARSTIKNIHPSKMVKDSILRVLGRFRQKSTFQMMTGTAIFVFGSPFKWVENLERLTRFLLKMKLIVPKAWPNYFMSIKLEKQTSYFHFIIYFTKNMSQLVYNEEIKSHDLHTDQKRVDHTYKGYYIIKRWLL